LGSCVNALHFSPFTLFAIERLKIPDYRP
jgi:hypothetical protein